MDYTDCDLTRRASGGLYRLISPRFAGGICTDCDLTRCAGGGLFRLSFHRGLQVVDYTDAMPGHQGLYLSSVLLGNGSLAAIRLEDMLK